jgi:hypothetical protein
MPGPVLPDNALDAICRPLSGGGGPVFPRYNAVGARLLAAVRKVPR